MKQQKNYDWHIFNRTFKGNIQIVCVCVLDKRTSLHLHETEQIKLVSNKEYNNYQNANNTLKTTDCCHTNVS